MKDLGTKSTLYPCSPCADGASEKEKVYYPSVRLPLDFSGDKKLVIGQEIEVRFKAKVTFMEQSEYDSRLGLDLTHGEIVEAPKQ